MDRVTRKELKTDHFAEKVGIAVDEVAAHKKEITRYGIIAAVVLVLIIGGVTWYRSQAESRRAAFDALLRKMETPVAAPGQAVPNSFASQPEKEKAIEAALEEFTRSYAGTNEEALARYFIASNAIEAGKLDKALEEVELAIRNGNADTAGIASFMKGNILVAQGKDDEAEKIYRQLLTTNSGFVSSGEVTVALAKLVGKKNPDEAIKLLEPLRLSEGAAQRIAGETIDQLRNARN